MFRVSSGYPDSMDASDPTEFPATDESAVEVLEDFAEAGWTANHLVRPEGEIKCGTCEETSSADRWVAEAEHRIEGASDPDDMQLVVGLSCPECEARGAIVIGYGPNGSVDDGDVLRRLDLDDVSDPIASN